MHLPASEAAIYPLKLSGHVLNNKSDYLISCHPLFLSLTFVGHVLILSIFYYNYMYPAHLAVAHPVLHISGMHKHYYLAD